MLRIGRQIAPFLFAVLLIPVPFWIGRAVRDRAGAAPHAAKTAPASIVFEPAELHLGEHLWGETIAFQLFAVNKGSRDETISGASTSCACTIVDSKHRGKTLRPGEGLSISGQVETRDKAGTRWQTVALSLASGASSIAKIGTLVKPSYTVDPEGTIDFGEQDITDGRRTVKTATFRSLHGRKIVGDPQLSCDWATCRVAGRPDGAELAVELDPSKLPVGRSTATLVVATDDPVVPSWPITVTVLGSQALVCRPGVVALFGTDPDMVHVTGPDGQAVEIVSVAASTTRIGARAVTGGRVEVGNTTGEPLSETASLRITDSRGRTGRVLVSAFPARGG